MAASRPLSIVETPQFLRSTKGVLDDDERAALVLHIAKNPLTGDLIEKTGGIRKARWARKGEGKSGGYRVWYVYLSDDYPLVLLTLVPKNVRENITKAQRNALRRQVEGIKFDFDAFRTKAGQAKRRR